MFLAVWCVSGLTCFGCLMCKQNGMFWLFLCKRFDMFGCLMCKPKFGKFLAVLCVSGLACLGCLVFKFGLFNA